MALPRGVGEAANVGQQFLGARYIQFAPGQHEIGLDVHFPEN
jgi:hypothetical protein